jgi:AcrR family transcriptional regulator
MGSFYRRFSGKQDLLQAMLAEEARRNTAVLAARTASGSPADRVLAWIDALVGTGFDERFGARTRWFTSMPAEVRRQHSERARQDPSIDIGAPLRQAIGDGVARGDFPHADPARDAAAIQALCGTLGSGDTRAFGADRAEVVRNVGQFVLAALTNPSTRST